jgi:sugar fermentation stimulation protein A
MALLKNSISQPGLQWPDLIPGVLVKRYKRFLTDIRLKDGQRITAHCPNTGSMRGCCEPERPVYVSFHDNPKRKLKYTWELIEMADSLVGVNTQIPNRLVFHSIQNNLIPELIGFKQIKREVRAGNHTRFDLCLSNGPKTSCYVEVKNCTLVEDGLASFPDAVTSRGLKHLLELQKQVAQGNQGVIFFLVQRMDAKSFSPADHIDPAYGRALREAVINGVKMLVYDVSIDLKSVCLNRSLPYNLL